jgi:hypothetical protein
MREPEFPDNSEPKSSRDQPVLALWSHIDKSFLLKAAAALIILLTVIWAVSYLHPKSMHRMNAQFIRYQEQDNIIHIGKGDIGNQEIGSAEVKTGQWIIIGHEWVYGGFTLKDVYNKIIYNPEAELFLSVDGGPWESVKKYFQDPFIPEVGTRPWWNWDHDGDGFGDGDGDGVGDWPGVPVVFVRIPFRYEQAGEHKYEFRYSETMGGYSATILVTVIKDP